MKLNEEEIAITTKRSATGGILLEIKDEKNKEIAEKLTEALRTALNKYQNVRVHRPRQMAELTQWDWMSRSPERRLKCLLLRKVVAHLMTLAWV